MGERTAVWVARATTESRRGHHWVTNAGERAGVASHVIHPAPPWHSGNHDQADHLAIGFERKAARLRYLRDRWMHAVGDLPTVTLLTPCDPAQGCAFTAIEEVDRLSFAVRQAAVTGI